MGRRAWQWGGGGAGGGWAGCPAAWWQDICSDQEEGGEGIEREEQCGGIKRRGHQSSSGAGQAGVKRRRQRQGKSAQGQADGKWYLKGFSTSPGGTKPVVGKYTVGAVESQVW